MMHVKRSFEDERSLRKRLAGLPQAHPKHQSERESHLLFQTVGGPRHSQRRPIATRSQSVSAAAASSHRIADRVLSRGHWRRQYSYRGG